MFILRLKISMYTVVRMQFFDTLCDVYVKYMYIQKQKPLQTAIAK